MQYIDDVLLNCTPETYIILLLPLFLPRRLRNPYVKMAEPSDPKILDHKVASWRRIVLEKAPSVEIDFCRSKTLKIQF